MGRRGRFQSEALGGGKLALTGPIIPRIRLQLQCENAQLKKLRPPLGEPSRHKSAALLSCSVCAMTQIELQKRSDDAVRELVDVLNLLFSEDERRARLEAARKKAH